MTENSAPDLVSVHNFVHNILPFIISVILSICECFFLLSSVSLSRAPGFSLSLTHSLYAFFYPSIFVHLCVHQCQFLALCSEFACCIFLHLFINIVVVFVAAYGFFFSSSLTSSFVRLVIFLFCLILTYLDAPNARFFFLVQCMQHKYLKWFS